MIRIGLEKAITNEQHAMSRIITVCSIVTGARGQHKEGKEKIKEGLHKNI
jgi:hypothetical protein